MSEEKVLVVAKRALWGAGLSIAVIIALFLVAVLPEVPGSFIALAAMLGIGRWGCLMTQAVCDLCDEVNDAQ